MDASDIFSILFRHFQNLTWHNSYRNLYATFIRSYHRYSHRTEKREKKTTQIQRDHVHHYGNTQLKYFSRSTFLWVGRNHSSIMMKIASQSTPCIQNERRREKKKYWRWKLITLRKYMNVIHRYIMAWHSLAPVHRNNWIYFNYTSSHNYA